MLKFTKIIVNKLSQRELFERVLSERGLSPSETLAYLSLDHEDRGKIRKRFSIEGGRDAALFLPRGSRLRDGDILVSLSGELLELKALPEDLMEARASSPEDFYLGIYQLGNRHAPCEILDGLRLRFKPSHPLKALMESLNFTVSEIREPFEPLVACFAHERGHGHGEDLRPGQDHNQDHNQDLAQEEEDSSRLFARL